jgi:hypothetical protein
MRLCCSVHHLSLTPLNPQMFEATQDEATPGAEQGPDANKVAILLSQYVPLHELEECHENLNGSLVFRDVEQY